jgi:beta-aspartyl-dipeptidase (metallo-type)
MLTLIENGDVYAPTHLGRRSVFLSDGKIGKVGEVNRSALERLGVEYEVLDVEGCIVAPGYIDPHQHLLGGSGEKGFASQTPEFFVSEIVRHGITTVVGCLGADTTMKTMAGLLAKVKGLKEEGLNAFLWTGGYSVPPTSIMDSVREDLMFIEEVIGVGEIALSDMRGMEPDPRELARVATDAFVGGMLAKKAGLTHIHLGDGKRRLEPLREVLEEYDVDPKWFYVTHIERNERLMREAIELTGLGVAADIDVVEGELAKWIRFYLDHDGDPGLLTVSTDAAIGTPALLHEELRKVVRGHVCSLEQALAFVTSNTARILKLEHKGSLEQGKNGDILVLEEGSLEIVHVLSNGEFMVRDGSLVASPRFLEESSRTIELVGAQQIT